MARQSKGQKQTVSRVMHEFKHGELKSSRGGKVKNPRQAVAIALSEAGASNQQSPRQNKRQLARSKRKERTGRTGQAQAEGKRGGGPTRAELYAQATKQGISGRSRMSKAELARAVRR